MRQGQLIYVIGPSGCGKDSLINYARKHCSCDEMAFAHRYITRPAEAGGENHVALTPEEFQARLQRGLFALNWESHGLCYGIGCEIDTWLKTGLNVAVNGSRAYLPTASERYPDILPVSIAVEPDILKQRLVGRGRESRAEINKRLQRAAEFSVSHPKLFEIDNSGNLSEGGEQLLKLIRHKQS